MAVKIQGTNSAASPAVSNDGNDGLVVGTDTIDLSIGGASKFKVGSAGQLGVGGATYGSDGQVLTSTGASSAPAGEDAASAGGADDLAFTATGKGVTWTANSSTGYIKANTASGHDLEFNVGGNLNQYRFKFGGTEKMRWHSNSTLRWGSSVNEATNYDTTQGIFWHGAASAPADIVVGTQSVSAAGLCLILNRSDTSDGIVAVFRRGGSSKGSISINSSSTTYSTSSDYRLKENAVPISDGITRLKTLKPYRFNFKVTPSIKVDGFFAHEVTAVPEAITGTKDAMKAETLYEEGDTLPSGKKVGDVKTYSSTKIDAQQIDQSKLVPLLTAALQEAIAKIETLETKVAALEAA